MTDTFTTSSGLRKALRESFGRFDWVSWGIGTFVWSAGLVTAMLFPVRSWVGSWQWTGEGAPREFAQAIAQIITTALLSLV